MPVLLLLASMAAAAWLRFALVEPAELTARCDAAPWQSVICAARSLTVQSFVHLRVGAASLGFALVALLVNVAAPRAVRLPRAVALVALVCGGAALMLYAAGPGAAGVLLALMIVSRTSFNDGGAR